MKKLNLITHGGKFHADEILAIATIELLHCIPQNVVMSIERVLTKKELEEVLRKEDKAPDVIVKEEFQFDRVVLDIGGVYAPDDKLFDHHQEPELEASCVLVLNHYCLDKDLVSFLYNRLFKQVSDLDRGIIKPEESSFNSIISSLNWLSSNEAYNFYNAIKVAQLYLESLLNMYKEIQKGKEMYFSLGKMGSFRIQREKIEIINWRDYALAEGVKGLITPSKRGGWQIISVSTDIYVVPATNMQTFRHNTGFIAVYENLEDLLIDIVK